MKRKGRPCNGQPFPATDQLSRMTGSKITRTKLSAQERKLARAHDAPITNPPARPWWLRDE